MALALAGVGAGVTLGSKTSGHQIRRVTGTLQIAVPSGLAGSTRGLALGEKGDSLPWYVSPSTTQAALFIDGASSPDGQTASCESSAGVGTGCTITWSAALSVPSVHRFAVEIDDGTVVLAEGKATYVVSAGTNSLSPPLSLNGVAGVANYSIGSCSSSACSGSVTMSDADSNSIVYDGSATVPTNGQNPTSSTVFDNNGGGTNNAIITSDNASIGTVTGTTSNPFATYRSGTLTLVGVNTTGVYPYRVACASGATGNFGIKISGLTTPSGDVTSTELDGLGGLSYPSGPDADYASLFTCTSGAISDVSGSLVTN